MKTIKKIALLIVMILVVCSLFTLSAFAATAEGDGSNSGKLDMSLKPESFGDRLAYALQGTVTGMLMIFAVLSLLTLILYGSKYVFYDIPNKKKQPKKQDAKEPSVKAPKVSVEAAAPEISAAPPGPTSVTEDEGELAAVITAAITAVLESEEYKNEFVGGFRVVSFKKSNRGAWNRK